MALIMIIPVPLFKSSNLFIYVITNMSDEIISVLQGRYWKVFFFRGATTGKLQPAQCGTSAPGCQEGMRHPGLQESQQQHLLQTGDYPVLVSAGCSLRRMWRFLKASRGGQVSWKPVLCRGAEHSGFVLVWRGGVWRVTSDLEGTWRWLLWTLLPGAQWQDAWEWLKTSPAKV